MGDGPHLVCVRECFTLQHILTTNLPFSIPHKPSAGGNVSVDVLHTNQPGCHRQPQAGSTSSWVHRTMTGSATWWWWKTFKMTTTTLCQTCLTINERSTQACTLLTCVMNCFHSVPMLSARSGWYGITYIYIYLIIELYLNGFICCIQDVTTYYSWPSISGGTSS